MGVSKCRVELELLGIEVNGLKVVHVVDSGHRVGEAESSR